MLVFVIGTSRCLSLPPHIFPFLLSFFAILNNKTTDSMGIESQAPVQAVVNLTPRQVKTFQKMEPKALGVSAFTQGHINISCRSHTHIKIKN